MAEHATLRGAIAEALDNAVANGYPLHTWTEEDIVCDLGTYCAGIEKLPALDVKLAVRAWLRDRLRKSRARRKRTGS